MDQDSDLNSIEPTSSPARSFPPYFNEDNKPTRMWIIISESIRTRLHLTLPQLYFKVAGFDPLVMSIFCLAESKSDF